MTYLSAIAQSLKEGERNEAAQITHSRQTAQYGCGFNFLGNRIFINLYKRCIVPLGSLNFILI